jgi:hypothetical protein
VASSHTCRDDDPKICVKTSPFLLHRLEDGPSQDVETSRGELLRMFKTMVTMRRYIDLKAFL